MCAQQIQEIKNVRPANTRNKKCAPSKYKKYQNWQETLEQAKVWRSWELIRKRGVMKQTGNNKLARRGGGLTSAKTTILNGKSETTYHLHVSDDIRDICVIKIQIYIKPFLAVPYSKYVFLIACFFLIKWGKPGLVFFDISRGSGW